METRARARRAEAERRAWVAATVRRETGGAGLAPPPQAAALWEEAADAFAAGLWIAALVLAQASLDAELAETAREGGGFAEDGGFARDGGFPGDGGLAGAAALNERRHGRGYAWLRRRRNALLHADGPGPAVTSAGRAADAPALERDARRALELAAKALAGRV